MQTQKNGIDFGIAQDHEDYFTSENVTFSDFPFLSIFS
jgi:hypothetical protein